MNLPNKKQCTICLRSDSEICSILSAVQQKLARLLKKQINFNKFQDQSSSSFQGFYRLIRVIFTNKFKHSKVNMNCRHQDIKKQFLKNLKCSMNVLNILCQQLSGVLGKFNYHIDTLTQQIKGFQRYLKPERNSCEVPEKAIKLQIENQYKAPKTSEQSSQSKQSSQNYEKIQKKVKTEACEFELENKIDVIAPLHSNFQINCINNPYDYYNQLNYMWYYQNE